MASCTQTLQIMVLQYTWGHDPISSLTPVYDAPNTQLSSLESCARHGVFLGLAHVDLPDERTSGPPDIGLYDYQHHLAVLVRYMIYHG